MAKTSRSRIQLAPDRRARLLVTLKKFYFGEFDDTLSDFRADALLDFFIRELGPAVYNQGVHDAVGYIQDKLGDIEGEIHEPDS